MPELNIQYLNELIDGIKQTTEKAYSIYVNEEQPDRQLLGKLYDEISEKMNAYYKHYKEAEADPKDGYLTAWLYEGENDIKLSHIYYYISLTNDDEGVKEE